ncbi:DUF3089 domain-containing protein [Nocardioides rubriscoriae]|uniref:DUF3089 domain-containing protein n=1 Tax=Nocardioides rubriscoriae TaxID=642762 RepID=UPI0014792F5F|nr:DUF3089 domain-containing protein [Nocardioides rubriscoriae]
MLTRARHTCLLTVLALVAGLLATTPAPAHAVNGSVSWLCRPAQGAQPCVGDLTTTVRRSDGTASVVRPARDRRPGVDCFYVYPTASQQPTPNARRTTEASVRAVARQQAMRFSQVCRTYAPLYRQRTLAALAAERAFTERQRAGFNRLAYRDVLTAWRSYLAHDNRGRPFLLVGHSQGSRLLRKLVREEIDPMPRLRRRLVSAILPGANVLVRRGRDRGGDFAHLRLCRTATQLHCVLAWSTFGDTPPDDSRFGRPPLDDQPSAGLGLPEGARYEVACTNPASLRRNARRPVTTLVRSEMLPGVLGVLALQLYGGPPPSADTPWLRPADRYSARCETVNGARVLLLRPLAGARHLSPSPDATWGLHLLDLNIALGDVLRIARRQVRAYQRRQ